MSMGLRIETEEIGLKIILRIDGRIDAASSSILEKRIQQLIEEHRSYLLLDFTNVEYLSSAGMRVLLASLKKIKALKGVFALFSVNEDVDDIIHLAGFDKILPIFSDEKDALQHSS